MGLGNLQGSMDLLTSGQTRIRNIEFIRAGDIVCASLQNQRPGLEPRNVQGWHTVPSALPRLEFARRFNGGVGGATFG